MEPDAAPKRARLALAAGLAAVALAGCGGGSSRVTRPPAASPSSVATTAAPTTAPPTTAAGGGSTQTLTVTPSAGLSSGQVVHLEAAGFSPGVTLVVTECAAKGTSTGPGDCNLGGMATVSSDTAGHVRADFAVVKGPFGANRIVCGPTQPCLVSVSQAVPSPTEEADAPISFR